MITTSCRGDVPAMIAMHFGAAPKRWMVAVPDHDGFGTCDRRRRDGDGAKRGNDVSKLLHAVLLG